MLHDFAFLWRNRERPDNSKRLLIVWVKRLLSAGPLLLLLLRPMWCRQSGGRIGRLVVLGKSRIEGNHRLLHIGDEVSLGRCHITLHDQVVIGRRAVINDGVNLLTASHYLKDPEWKHKKAPIFIGDYAWIATNAILLPGVKIGRGAVVGAGAVVREDVPDYAVVVGNPAKLTSAKRVEELIYSPVLLNAPFEAWVGKTVSMPTKRSSFDE